jgi:hypothetical protein
VPGMGRRFLIECHMSHVTNAASPSHVQSVGQWPTYPDRLPLCFPRKPGTECIMPVLASAIFATVHHGMTESPPLPQSGVRHWIWIKSAHPFLRIQTRTHGGNINAKVHEAMKASQGKDTSFYFLFFE